MFPVDIVKFLRIAWLFLAVLLRYGKSIGGPVLWCRASTCFRFLWKTFTKSCTNNTLLSRDKIFLACMNWLVTCFWFQNIFWKTINCFRFWWETYTKCCTSNYLTSHVKRLYFAIGWVLSVSGYDLENGRMPCKQKCYIKNMAVKIPILILFRFCLLC